MEDVDEATRIAEEGSDDDGDHPIITVHVDDRVRTIRGHTGIVRYIGPVEFSIKEMVGIELDQWSPNAHDGTVKAKRYFVCPNGRGSYLTHEAISENLGSTRRRRRESVEIKPLAPLPPPPEVNIGDRIKLSRGKTGVVKYIGSTDFSHEPLVGVELDSWSANAHDGTVKGTQYFQTAPGRGYFTRRQSVSQLLIPKFNKMDGIKLAKRERKKQIGKMRRKIRQIEILISKRDGG